jgi:hypothetical protein
MPFREKAVAPVSARRNGFLCDEANPFASAGKIRARARSDVPPCRKNSLVPGEPLHDLVDRFPLSVERHAHEIEFLSGNTEHRRTVRLVSRGSENGEATSPSRAETAGETRTAKGRGISEKLADVAVFPLRP